MGAEELSPAGNAMAPILEALPKRLGPFSPSAMSVPGVQERLDLARPLMRVGVQGRAETHPVVQGVEGRERAVAGGGTSPSLVNQRRRCFIVRDIDERRRVFLRCVVAGDDGGDLGRRVGQDSVGAQDAGKLLLEPHRADRRVHEAREMGEVVLAQLLGAGGWIRGMGRLLCSAHILCGDPGILCDEPFVVGLGSTSCQNPPRMEPPMLTPRVLNLMRARVSLRDVGANEKKRNGDAPRSNDAPPTPANNHGRRWVDREELAQEPWRRSNKPTEITHHGLSTPILKSNWRR
ncbi:hypothetical protein B0H14DRAFT_2624035 [Mycena olivaceomarginata]|nr:hypothetical protein B0H14DRAFT_2624035 [Mycena olivaceomarginata]